MLAPETFGHVIKGDEGKVTRRRKSCQRLWMNWDSAPRHKVKIKSGEREQGKLCGWARFDGGALSDKAKTARLCVFALRAQINMQKIFVCSKYEKCFYFLPSSINFFVDPHLLAGEQMWNIILAVFWDGSLIFIFVILRCRLKFFVMVPCICQRLSFWLLLGF